MIYIYVVVHNLNFKLLLIQIGDPMLMITNKLLGLLSSLAPIQFPGHQKNKNVISHSNIEFEYQSIAPTLADIKWIINILHELHVSIVIPIIFLNNLGVVLMAANPIMHSKTKHFELELHFICNVVQQIYLLFHACTYMSSTC